MIKAGDRLKVKIRNFNCIEEEVGTILVVTHVDEETGTFDTTGSDHNVGGWGFEQHDWREGLELLPPESPAAPMPTVRVDDPRFQAALGAMNALISNAPDLGYEETAEQSVAYADHLLAELEK